MLARNYVRMLDLLRKLVVALQSPEPRCVKLLRLLDHGIDLQQHDRVSRKGCVAA